jgi:hypothetical protein
VVVAAFQQCLFFCLNIPPQYNTDLACGSEGASACSVSAMRARPSGNVCYGEVKGRIEYASVTQVVSATELQATVWRGSKRDGGAPIEALGNVAEYICGAKQNLEKNTSSTKPCLIKGLGSF